MTPEEIGAARGDAAQAVSLVAEHFPKCCPPSAAHPQEPALLLAGLALRMAAQIEMFAASLAEQEELCQR